MARTGQTKQVFITSMKKGLVKLKHKNPEILFYKIFSFMKNWSEQMWSTIHLNFQPFLVGDSYLFREGNLPIYKVVPDRVVFTPKRQKKWEWSRGSTESIFELRFVQIIWSEKTFKVSRLEHIFFLSGKLYEQKKIFFCCHFQTKSQVDKMR